MPKGAPSSSTRLLFAAGLLVLGACARDAVSLPSDTPVAPLPEVSAEQRASTCAKLSADIATARSEMNTIEQVIKGHRHADQVEGYLAAVLFPPLALAIDQQKAQKATLDDRQRQIDSNLAQQRALKCPSS